MHSGEKVDEAGGAGSVCEGRQTKFQVVGNELLVRCVNRGPPSVISDFPDRVCPATERVRRDLDLDSRRCTIRHSVPRCLISAAA